MLTSSRRQLWITNYFFNMWDPHHLWSRIVPLFSYFVVVLIWSKIVPFIFYIICLLRKRWWSCWTYFSYTSHVSLILGMGWGWWLQESMEHYFLKWRYKKSVGPFFYYTWSSIIINSTFLFSSSLFLWRTSQDWRRYKYIFLRTNLRLVLNGLRNLFTREDTRI